MNRNDIIVRHFAKNEETQFGGAEFQVIKGTATSGDATDPEITDTDLRAGALTHDMKIYRARLEGLNVVAVEPLFEVLPSIPELNGKMELSEYNLDNLNIYEENGIVHVNGMVAINAATGNIQLPYANAGIKDVHAPVIGVFQDMSIAGYGYLNLGRNTNAAYIGMNTAVTYAIMAFSYKGQ